MNRIILKKKIFLCIVLVLALVLPLLVQAPQGQAWLNGRNRYDNSWLEAVNNEYAVDDYIFEVNPGGMPYSSLPENANHYGAHDWVADSALRLLIMKGYKDEIKWLFSLDPEYDIEIPDENGVLINDRLSIDGKHNYYPLPLSEFDSYGAPSGSRAWWDEKHYSDCGDGLTMPQWMMARRYARFLHGTKLPDYGKLLTIGRNYAIPSESIQNYAANWIATKGYGGHSAAFRKVGSSYWEDADWEYFNHLGKDPAILALQAGLDAIWYLTYVNPTTQKPQPKFEAAAMCLGAMCHLISDAAVLGHMTHYKRGGSGSNKDDIINVDGPQWISGSDVGWENWVALPSGGGTHTWRGLWFDPDFAYGGPGWKNFGSSGFQSDPSWLNPDKPLPPSQCLRELGYLAFTGYDKEKKDQEANLNQWSAVRLSALDHRFDVEKHDSNDPYRFYDDNGDGSYSQTQYYTKTALPNSEVRVYEMPEWAAYYCAKAIRWVMSYTDLKGKSVDDTISDRWTDPVMPSGKTSRSDYKTIKHWIEVGKEDWYIQHWITVNNPALEASMNSGSYAIMLVATLAIPAYLVILPKKKYIELEAND